MEKVGIFYGSSTGNTETAAKQIQRELGENIAEVKEVTDAKGKDLDNYTNLIFGSSTWGVGDLQDDFDSFLSEIESANLEGKKVAIFGLGDQDGYADSFVDAIGIIYDVVKDKGCEVVGFISKEGYNYDASKADLDDKLVGLPLDEENQGTLTNERIKNWVQQLKEELN